MRNTLCDVLPLVGRVVSPAGRGPKVQALVNLSIEAINADDLTKSQWSASNGAKELD